MFGDISDKQKEFELEFKKLLPNVLIHNIKWGTEKEVNTCSYSIYPDNSNLYESQYSFKDNSSLIHFTSIEVLESVLYNKSIRLYNLNNLEDPREFSFAGDALTLDEKNRNDNKTNFFLLSMCKNSILKDKVENEFNMWQLYGHKGNGVCIELEFSESDRFGWRDYFLSEVFYGGNSRTNIKQIGQFIKKYETEKPAILLDLGQIACFHKSNLYKLEQEVRLLFDFRTEKHFSNATYEDDNKILLAPIIHQDLSKTTQKGKIVQYLQLPIFTEDIKRINNKIPLPKITRIILGYGYKSNYDEISKILYARIQQQLGYDIPIELSRLTKYFYESVS